jgi:hypothetical protein
LHERRPDTHFEPTEEIFAAYRARWLDIAATAQCPGTVDRYRRIVRLHIVPAIGSIPRAKLSGADVQALQAKLVADGAGPGSDRLHHAVMRRALDLAGRWRLIPANPCDFVHLPRVPRSE